MIEKVTKYWLERSYGIKIRAAKDDEIWQTESRRDEEKISQREDDYELVYKTPPRSSYKYWRKKNGKKKQEN